MQRVPTRYEPAAQTVVAAVTAVVGDGVVAIAGVGVTPTPAQATTASNAITTRCCIP